PKEKLPFVDGAIFDSNINYHEENGLLGTRADIICEIKEWAFTSQGKCTFLLSGMAGTGKSTTSRTVAEHFNEAKSLGANFCFKRGEADRGNAQRPFSLIVRQLIISVPQLIPYIDPDIMGKGIRDQFDKLPLQLLLCLGLSELPFRTTVIVLDALD
ncbi:hypothetical protein N7478_000205, partial [Penicillium angulare]|uniref:uncharacterized protein n=1 Tax=Penicillium angulare TaxID=116970 RepID=UPI002541B68B